MACCRDFSPCLNCRAKAELADSLKLYVRWEPKFAATRTGMRLAGRKPFYHRRPLIRRQEVSLEKEILAPASLIEKLCKRREKRFSIWRARDFDRSLSRAVWLYSWRLCESVARPVGRGVELFITGLPPKKTSSCVLYHAAMILKNGVPVGY